MFRHIFSSPRQDRQLAEENKRITELEGQVARLNSQNMRLSEEKQEEERMKAACYEKIAEFVTREALLVAFLKALDSDAIKKTRGGADIIRQRDALVKKAESLEPTLVDCPYCHGAHYTGQRCPLAPQ